MAVSVGSSLKSTASTFTSRYLGVEGPSPRGERALPPLQRGSVVSVMLHIPSGSSWREEPVGSLMGADTDGSSSQELARAGLGGSWVGSDIVACLTLLLVSRGQGALNFRSELGLIGLRFPLVLVFSIKNRCSTPAPPPHD